MIKQLWQKFIAGIKRWWGRIFGAAQKRAIAPPPKSADNQLPLDDAGYEFVFMQLLEGVHQGWTEFQVQKYLSQLCHRTTETGWVEWLERFGDRLLANPLPNHELASRLLQLGTVEPGIIGIKSSELSRALLNKTLTPGGESQPMIPEAESLFYQGNQYYQERQYSLAISCWDRALALKSDFYQVWTNRGVALNNLGRYEEALASYDRALDVKEDYDVAWSNRGVALRNLDRFSEALQSYDKAIELQPNTFDPWLNRGTVLSGFQRYEEAFISFQKATEIQPERYEGWLGQGRMLIALERYDEAILIWDEVIEKKENLADAWKHRAIALYYLQRYEEAIAACDRALKLEPEDQDTISYWSKSQARLSGLAAQQKEQEHSENISQDNN